MSVHNIEEENLVIETPADEIKGYLHFTGAFVLDVPFQAVKTQNMITLAIAPVIAKATTTAALTCSLPSTIASTKPLVEPVPCQIIDIGTGLPIEICGSLLLDGTNLTIRPSLNYSGTTTFTLNDQYPQGTLYSTIITYL